MTAEALLKYTRQTVKFGTLKLTKMKGLMLIITLLGGSALYGQMSEKIVHYTFKVIEVTNETHAKNLSAEIKNYFDVTPVFNDETDEFKVNSYVLISKEQFEERMTAKGLHVELFEQSILMGDENTKH